VHASKAKQGIHSLLPTGRHVFSHPQESRAPSHVTVTWEDKHHNFECVPPFCLLPPDLHAEHDIIQHGASLGSAGLSCPSRVPYQLPMLPQPPHCWGGVRSRKGPDSA